MLKSNQDKTKKILCPCLDLFVQRVKRCFFVALKRDFVFVDPILHLILKNKTHLIFAYGASRTKRLAPAFDKHKESARLSDIDAT